MEGVCGTGVNEEAEWVRFEKLFCGGGYFMMADGKDLGEDKAVNETPLACISLSRFLANIMIFSLQEFALNITTHHQLKTAVRLT